MPKKFYITTTLPYVNAEPHIGFALEIIEADVLARFHRNLGDEVFFNTGTDEHGIKIYQKAQELGISTQEYVDDLTQSFLRLKERLNVSFNSFIRTTDKKHAEAVQEFWKMCEKNGDIYKKNYKVKYCIGCEMEKTDSELENGKCPLHPNKELEIIEEENYFFRYSKYQDKLLDLYKSNPNFVKPDFRFNEIRSFVERGLSDFSISRLESKLPWGVPSPSPAPDEEPQVTYVWFDALVNYIEAIGWPENMENFKKWWPAVQICGKDNLRPQAAMWQAMLMSAGIEPSKQIFVNGFVMVAGQKMSKSLGNVISPFEMVDKFGIDATRYLLLSFGNFGEDIDVTWERLTEKYNADLANGLGNLLSRVVKLAENLENQTTSASGHPSLEKEGKGMVGMIEKMELGNALSYIWKIVQENNKFIEDTKPWELVKNNPEKFKEVMQKLVSDLYLISELLAPFMPETSEKIKKALETKKLEEVLFQRIK